MNDKVRQLRQRLDQEARRKRINLESPSLTTETPCREKRIEVWSYGLLLVIALCAAFWAAVIWLV